MILIGVTNLNDSEFLIRNHGAGKKTMVNPALYPAKMSFRKDRGSKTFSDEGN